MYAIMGGEEDVSESPSTYQIFSLAMHWSYCPSNKRRLPYMYLARETGKEPDFTWDSKRSLASTRNK